MQIYAFMLVYFPHLVSIFFSSRMVYKKKSKLRLYSFFSILLASESYTGRFIFIECVDFSLNRVKGLKMENLLLLSEVNILLRYKSLEKCPNHSVEPRLFTK